MSLASNPWPTFEAEDGGGRPNEMMQPRQNQPPPRFRPNPMRNDQAFAMSRSTSHDTTWGARAQAVATVGPTVGVVQPLNAQRQQQQHQQTLPDTQKYKALNRRNIPPHVPPRNDQAPNVKDFAAYKEHQALIQQQRAKQQSASDPWKATLEQKKYYADEFDKLPKAQTKVQDYLDGQLCLFVEGHVAKQFLLKSKLPNDALVHIWELADIDRDGRLTAFEFSLAFHFTLAKQRNFPLPDQIPRRLYEDLRESVPEPDYPIIDQGEAVKVEEENWEEFSEKSFSTVSSASTLPNFVPTPHGSKKLDGFVQPVPMRMTPSSMAARNNSQVEHMIQPLDISAEGSMESKRKMYLELERLPGADESSSAQSSSSSSPVSDEQSTGIHESQSNLSYSSSKPLNPSGDDESHDDSVDHGATLKPPPNAQKFAEFPSYQNLTSSGQAPSSVDSSVDSADNEDSIHRAPTPPVVPSSESIIFSSDEKREREIEQVRSMVSSLKERNGRLRRLNQALSIELKDIIAERVRIQGSSGE